MVQRMSDSESSLGEKLILVETIQMAVVYLSNSSEILNKDESASVESKYMTQLKKDNNFFEIKSIFDEPMISSGTIIRKSKALES